MLHELKAFFRGFSYAFSGIIYAVRSQRNMRFHLCAGITALVMSFICGISDMELCVVLLCISAVISSELMNTAVESAADIASGEKNDPLAKAAKDCAAGAVLISALVSAACGAVIFLRPERLALLADFFAGKPFLWILSAAWLAAAFVFVFGKKNKKK